MTKQTKSVIVGCLIGALLAAVTTVVAQTSVRLQTIVPALGGGAGGGFSNMVHGLYDGDGSDRYDEQFVPLTIDPKAIVIYEHRENQYASSWHKIESDGEKHLITIGGAGQAYRALQGSIAFEPGGFRVKGYNNSNGMTYSYMAFE